MSLDNNVSLTDEELTELDEFLLSGAEGVERLTIDEAHGYITALIVSGKDQDSTDWLGAVLDDLAFTDDAEQERIEDLLYRMWDEIEEMLRSRQVFEPLVAEFEEDGELIIEYEGWCYGFMLAVSEDETLWNELPKDEKDLLAPIAQIALLGEDEEVDLDDEEYEMLAELIPGSVGALYNFWHNLH